MKNNLKILIADDNVILANFIKKYIEENSNHIVIGIAKSSKEQMEMMNMYNSDVIITDNLRKGEKISGIDIILNSEKNNRKEKFLLITVSHISEILVNTNFSMPKNIIGYLRKPFEFQSIIEKLKV